MPRKATKVKAVPSRSNFAGLVQAVHLVHAQGAAAASRAVNMSLTLRNWLIGMHIYEYEQGGADRAKYGQHLLARLSQALEKKKIRGADIRALTHYRRFYLTYPNIWGSLTPKLKMLFPKANNVLQPIRGSLTPELNLQFPTHHIVKNTLQNGSQSDLGSDGATLISHLSFTHLAELIEIEDPIQRAFYEVECIRGNWSVRSLKRQIATLYFERSGLSRNKKKLAAMVQANAEQEEPIMAIRDPYIFEFLGLRSKETVSESDLEDALLDKLQELLLELGHGFCFEARQKSIVIGRTRGFVDLVFYHRVLKCHVLVELKVDKFRQEHLGQLNNYVEWYRQRMMGCNDNPPIGLLLCTQKDHALVEFALSAVDNKLFVSKYKLNLPSKNELLRFLQEQQASM